MEIYCTQLGMITRISYCFSANEGLPCRNIIGCWEQRFDIVGYLLSKYSDDQLKQIFGDFPKSRIMRIFDAMEAARNKK